MSNIYNDFVLYVQIGDNYVPLSSNLDDKLDNKFSTVDEVLNEEENSKYTLTFKMPIKIVDNGITKTHPLMPHIYLGTRLKLQWNGTLIYLIISNMKPSSTTHNIVYEITAQDEPSYLWSRQHVGYSYRTEDGEGNLTIKTIYEIAKEILTNNFLHKEAGGKWSLPYLDQDIQTDYDNYIGYERLTTQQFSLEIENSNPYAALVEACNTVNAYMKIDHKNYSISFFRKDNVQDSGYRYHPDRNLLTYSSDYSGEEICTMLHVSGGEDEFGNIITLTPDIPPNIEIFLKSTGGQNLLLELKNGTKTIEEFWIAVKTAITNVDEKGNLIIKDDYLLPLQLAYIPPVSIQFDTQDNTQEILINNITYSESNGRQTMSFFETGNTNKQYTVGFEPNSNIHYFQPTVFLNDFDDGIPPNKGVAIVQNHKNNLNLSCKATTSNGFSLTSSELSYETEGFSLIDTISGEGQTFKILHVDIWELFNSYIVLWDGSNNNYVAINFSFSVEEGQEESIKAQLNYIYYEADVSVEVNIKTWTLDNTNTFIQLVFSENEFQVFPSSFDLLTLKTFEDKIAEYGVDIDEDFTFLDFRPTFFSQDFNGTLYDNILYTTTKSQLNFLSNGIYISKDFQFQTTGVAIKTDEDEQQNIIRYIYVPNVNISLLNDGNEENGIAPYVILKQIIHKSQEEDYKKEQNKQVTNFFAIVTQLPYLGSSIINFTPFSSRISQNQKGIFNKLIQIYLYYNININFQTKEYFYLLYNLNSLRNIIKIYAQNYASACIQYNDTVNNQNSNQQDKQNALKEVQKCVDDLYSCIVTKDYINTILDLGAGKELQIELQKQSERSFILYDMYFKNEISTIEKNIQNYQNELFHINNTENNNLRTNISTYDYYTDKIKTSRSLISNFNNLTVIVNNESIPAYGAYQLVDYIINTVLLSQHVMEGIEENGTINLPGIYKDYHDLLQKRDANFTTPFYNTFAQFIYEQSYDNPDELDSIALYNQAVAYFADINKPQASYSAEVIDICSLEHINVPKLSIGNYISVYNPATINMIPYLAEINEIEVAKQIYAQKLNTNAWTTSEEQCAEKQTIINLENALIAKYNTDKGLTDNTHPDYIQTYSQLESKLYEDRLYISSISRTLREPLKDSLTVEESSRYKTILSKLIKSI